MEIQQYPQPGVHLLRFRGDVQRFSLRMPEEYAGRARMRTNIGQAGTIRREIHRSVLEELPPLGLDWFDIPMRPLGGGRFEVVIPLLEVGHFEAKCYFLPEDAADPLWPPGDNTVLNVEPAHTCCANILYNAFVRQFGGEGQGAPEADTEALDHAGYTVIPPSGTFRDLAARLDFIFGTLGCRYLQLLPIHPTPTTYARMGRFGSPYAALSFTAVDPALAVFDPHATPLEQFVELLDGVHRRHGKLILDIAINHTGWAAELHGAHPEWLSRDEAGRIEVPGAWGVAWADLTKLDFRRKDLWQYMAEVFLVWCRRGVDGFRCDAGYMIPLAAWRFIIASVREQYPDTVFLLEGLGGKLSVTRRLMDRGNFNWAYSELFQNYDRGQIEGYLPGANTSAEEVGLMVHFAETHDNPRLAARSRTWARMRTDLCALFSPNGAFGFANGVEWFATEKIDVHGAPSLNWGAPENQVAAIGRLSALLKRHPAFQDRTRLSLVQAGPGNHVALLRRHRPTGKSLLVVANLEEGAETLATWEPGAFDAGEGPLVDLLTEERITPTLHDGLPGCRLAPGRVVCLTRDPEELGDLEASGGDGAALVPRILDQRLRAKALEVLCSTSGQLDVTGVDPDREARSLHQDPQAYCRKMSALSPEPGYVPWQWPMDARREVMVPPGHFLLVRAPSAFRARIMAGRRTVVQEESLPASDGSWFALFTPQPKPVQLQSRTLALSLFSEAACRHAEAPLLYLPEPDALRVPILLGRRDLAGSSRMFLATNTLGGMLRAPLVWGRLESRYDGLLAANRDPKHPEDRWMLLSRCRCWVLYQGYSQALRFDCFHTFHTDTVGRGVWRFHVPTGQGEHVRLTVRVAMDRKENSVHLLFYRHPAGGREGRLADEAPVRLIVRPDVESRNFHQVTKAYQGPEEAWRGAVTPRPDGFLFAPDPGCHLTVIFSGSRFVPEPEWQYMVARPGDADRGQDPDSDLFSPGYFRTELPGGTPAVMTAHAGSGHEEALKVAGGAALSEEELYGVPGEEPVEQALARALERFVVRRGGLKTVIAGYPWFLDWGRDALIVVRGLVAAGRLTDARAVLRQFGQYERAGTLPNMIAGDRVANRDTSDAPLWFFAGCRDMVDREDSLRFLDTRVGRRTVREVLFSIAAGYMAGTENGVRMDVETGLIYSPAHFTWMDTNFPAASPREGYPIEIQALWHHALSFLDRIDPAQKRGPWRALGDKVQTAIRERYVLPELGYLADCLHTVGNGPVAGAEADDHLRPNQLLAITLGAVTDRDLCAGILAACQELLVPGAIRSLADRPVRRPLPVVHNGTPLNDPRHPYWGRYAGDEDTRRKPAYHNGTAWAWLMPSFCEAWGAVYGPDAGGTAAAWLGSSLRLLSEGCLGQLPEILDGDAPHRQRGCDAQAWSVSELYRVWLKLKKQPNGRCST